MNAILKSALAYSSVVFALGFALGTLRVVVTAQLLGPTWATIVELPVMLVASWIVCRWAMARWRIPPTPAPRLAAGGTAFALLIGAEIALGLIAFGLTLDQVLSSYRQTGPLLGLLAQILFGLFPRVQAARAWRR